MTRALLVAGLLVGTSSVAAAGPIGIGGYAGLGIGPGGGVSASGDGLHSVEKDGRSGQIFGGIRFKGAPIVSRLAVEVSLAANSFVVNDMIGFDARMIGIAGKYSHPLGGGMELFGKLGVAHTSYRTDSPYGRDVDGAQALIAIGAEYRIPLAVQVSVLVDYTIYAGTLSNDVGTIEGNSRLWKLGFTVGF